MKDPHFSCSFSGDWKEFGLGLHVHVELNRSVVTENMELRGRWAGIFVDFLWWKVNLSWLFSTLPLEP